MSRHLVCWEESQRGGEMPERLRGLERVCILQDKAQSQGAGPVEQDQRAPPTVNKTVVPGDLAAEMWFL